MQESRPRSAIQRRTLVLILLLATILSGCSYPSPTPTPTVTPTLKPTPTQTPTAAPEPTPTPSRPGKPVTDPAGRITMEVGKKVAVRANATGAERYEWDLQGDGLISATAGDAILYITPAEGSGTAIVTVIAHNAQGASSPTSLVIDVLPIATVRLDALAIPSCVGSSKLFINWAVSPHDCYTGSDCLRFTYRPGGEWGRTCWWPFCIASAISQTSGTVPGDTCSINVLKAGNLSEVNRLTFWARGDQGGEIIEFRVGGVDISPTPGRSLGRVTLTSTWQEYEIGLENMGWTNAIGLFIWFATDSDNPQGAVFYLDDIQFEGVKEARQPPQSAGQNLADMLSRLCWIAYSPTHFDPTTSPIQWPSEEDVREDLFVLRSAGFNGLVTYGSNYASRDAPDQVLDIPRLAQEAGFEGMIVGVWDPTGENELRAAEQAGLYPVVVGYCVGNEGLDVRYDLDTLVSAMNRLRRTTGKPVATTEEVQDYYENSPLWTISDWIFPNTHPYFSGYRDPPEAVAWTERVFETLASVSDKPLIFKEVGLPSGGDTDLSEARQAQYYQLLRGTNVTYVVFEAFDAPWKHLGQPGPDGTYPLPDPEPHWGVFTRDRMPKKAVADICPVR